MSYSSIFSSIRKGIPKRSKSPPPINSKEFVKRFLPKVKQHTERLGSSYKKGLGEGVVGKDDYEAKIILANEIAETEKAKANEADKGRSVAEAAHKTLTENYDRINSIHESLLQEKEDAQNELEIVRREKEQMKIKHNDEMVKKLEEKENALSSFIKNIGKMEEKSNLILIVDKNNSKLNEITIINFF